MFIKITAALMSAAFVLLAGCTSLNVKENNLTMAEQSSALLVGSVSLPHLKEQVDAKVRYYFQAVNSPEQDQYIVEVMDAEFDSQKELSDLPTRSNSSKGFVVETKQYDHATFETGDLTEQDGKVFSLELPAGQYQLVRWSLVNQGVNHIHPRSLEPITFEVKAGQVNYIGNIHMQLKLATDAFGANMAVGSPVQFLDQQQRDLALVDEKLAQQYDLAQVKNIVPAQDSWVQSASATTAKSK